MSWRRGELAPPLALPPFFPPFPFYYAATLAALVSAIFLFCMVKMMGFSTIGDNSRIEFTIGDTPVLDWRQSSGSSRLETNASKIGVIFPAWCVTPRWTNASLSRRVVLGGEFMSPHIHPLPTTLLQETDVLQSRTTVAAGVA